MNPRPPSLSSSISLSILREEKCLEDIDVNILDTRNRTNIFVLRINKIRSVACPGTCKDQLADLDFAGIRVESYHLSDVASNAEAKKINLCFADQFDKVCYIGRGLSDRSGDFAGAETNAGIIDCDNAAV